MPQIESLIADPISQLQDLPLRYMNNLRSLAVMLSVEQLERLCGLKDEAPPLPRLHTLDVTLGDAATPNATPIARVRRLACLSRLAALRSLIIRDPHCCPDAMMPLAHAQRQDPSAFKDLRSYSYLHQLSDATELSRCYYSQSARLQSPQTYAEWSGVAAMVDPPYERRNVTAAKAAALRDEIRQEAAAAMEELQKQAAVGAGASCCVSFPQLTSVQLTCCDSDMLMLHPSSIEAADPAIGIGVTSLNRLCAQIPNVRSMRLGLHAWAALFNHEKWRAKVFVPDFEMDAKALSWCRSPALHSLRHLHTLEIDRLGWGCQQVTAAMLADVHALGAAMAELSCLEITNVCRLATRAEVCGLMTLKEMES
jgi:hypothetical protein